MAQPLIEVLSQVRGGYCLHLAAKKLAEVIAAVNDVGDPGEVVLTIKVMRDKNDSRVLKIQPKVKHKVPEKGLAEGYVFLDSRNYVTNQDPAQLDLLEERKAAGVATIQRGEAALEQVGRGGS
jgi:hypothetical protein